MQEHPKVAELTKLTAELLLGAAAERRGPTPDAVQALGEERGLGAEQADTPFGNPVVGLAALDSADATVRALLGWLLARALPAEPRESAADRRALGLKLAWLSAHTAVDGLGALADSELPDREEIWLELARAAMAADRGELGPDHRPLLLALLSAVVGEQAPDSARALLREGLDDPRYQAMLERGARPSGERPAGSREPISGELVAAPWRAWQLALGALTGVLLVCWLLRILGRLVLRIRRPAELAVSERLLVLRSRTEVMGRPIRTLEQTIPVENLALAACEVRYPRLAMYVGMLCLALGSYLGVSLWVDGARAASPSLLGVGAIVFGIGIAIDLVGSSLLPGRAGRTRLVLVPRKGGALALRIRDRALATEALRRLGPSV